MTPEEIAVMQEENRTLTALVAELLPLREHVIVHPVTHCASCQQDLQGIPALQVERRQVFDVPTPRLWVAEHQAEQKQCPACQQITIASFPPEVAAPLQYGPRLGALAVYL